VHLGRIGGAAVVGLSGTAYAVTIAAHLFLRPLLRVAAGLASDDPFQDAITDFSRLREPGRAEALPVRTAWRDRQLHATSAGRFGQLSALAAMDGFALIAAEAGDVHAGDGVSYHPLMMPIV
jgi:molybdopterin biosynthesis enzyme